MSAWDTASVPAKRRHWLDWRWPVFALYVALISYTSLHHEPWDDECHAWLMARELPLDELAFKYIPYEGTPPLWHTILWCAAHVGAGLGALPIIAVVFAAIGTALLLWRSPLPTGLKLLIPFGYWNAYQYAVVARSYVLVAPAFFLLAICWPRRMERPWRTVGLLAIIASTSAHGYAAAGAIAAIMSVELLWTRRTLSARQLRSAVVALGALVLFAGVVFLHLRKPSDITFNAQNPGLPWMALKNAARSIVDHVWTPYRLLTAITLAISAWWFYRTRTLLLWIVPSAALFMLLWLLWRQEWHLGMLYVVWLWVLWVSLGTAKHTRTIRRGERWLATAVFAVAIGSQISWTIHTTCLDWQFPYSGSHAAQRFLKEKQLDGQPLAGVGFPCVSVQAYFDRPLYLNWNRRQPPAMWWWSQQFDYFDNPADVIAAQPAAIIRPVKPPLWRSSDRYPGYFKAAVFPGHLYFQDFVKEENSYELWLPLKDTDLQKKPDPECK